MNSPYFTELPLRNLPHAKLEDSNDSARVALKKTDSVDSLAPHLFKYSPKLLETTACILRCFQSVIPSPGPLRYILAQYGFSKETADEQIGYFIEYYYPVKRFLKDGQMFKESDIISVEVFSYLVDICNHLLSKESALKSNSELSEDIKATEERLTALLRALKLIRIYSRVDKVVSQCGVACLEMLRKMPRVYPLPSVLDADRWASVANLGYSSSSQAHILQSGFIPEILNELQQAPQNNSVQIELYAIINNFASNAQCGKEVAQKGGATYLMDSMSKQLDNLETSNSVGILRRTDDEMMIQGMMALTALGVHSPLLDKARFCNLLDRILSKFGYGNLNLVMGVCRAIGFLTFAETFDHSIQHVMLRILLGCMEGWAQDISLQKCICFALAHLLFKRNGNGVGGGAEDAAAASISTLSRESQQQWETNVKRVCDLVLQATLNFESDIALQTTAMFCVSSLSMHGDTIKKHLCAINAPKIIMHSMEIQTRHIQQTKITELKAASVKLSKKATPVDSAVVVEHNGSWKAPELPAAQVSSSTAPNAEENHAYGGADSAATRLDRSASIVGPPENAAVVPAGPAEEVEPNNPQQQNPLLLQIFASSALLNLSENPECHSSILQSGALHWVHNALKLVHKERDLAFMLYYLFMRLTPSMNRRICLYYGHHVPSLKQLCRKAIVTKIIGNWNDIKRKTQKRYLQQLKQTSNKAASNLKEGSLLTGPQNETRKSSSSLLAKLQDWIPFPSSGSAEAQAVGHSCGEGRESTCHKGGKRFATSISQASFSSFINETCASNADPDSEFLQNEPGLVTRRYYIRQAIDTLGLPPQLRSEVSEFVICGACESAACIKSDMRLYEVSTGSQLATGLLNRIVTEHANDNRANEIDEDFEGERNEFESDNESMFSLSSHRESSITLQSQSSEASMGTNDNRSSMGSAEFAQRCGTKSARLSLLSIQTDSEASLQVARLPYTECRFLETCEDQDEDDLGNSVDSARFKKRLRCLKRLNSASAPHSKWVPDLSAIIPSTLTESEPLLFDHGKPKISGSAQTINGFMVCSAYCADRIQRIHGPTTSWAKLIVSNDLPLIAARRAD